MIRAGFEVGELTKAITLLSNSSISPAQSDGALRDVLRRLGRPPSAETLRRLGI